MSDKVKQYYTLCSYAGVDGKKLLKDTYGLESASDATRTQLCELINHISEEGNKWRRRVMAAIGSDLEKRGLKNEAKSIKAIACRAAKCKSFNSIPHNKLQAIYNHFSKPASSRKLQATSL